MIVLPINPARHRVPLASHLGWLPPPDETSTVREASGGKGVTPDSILLTAMTFAQEAEAERARAERVMDLATRGARELLLRVDMVLGEEGSGEVDDGSGEDDAT